MPVLGSRLVIPREDAEAAYERWRDVNGPSAARYWPLARILERGGFGTSELDEWVPNWRERARER